MKLVHLLSSFFALAECAFADTAGNVVHLAARQLSADLSLSLSRDSLISVEAPPRWSSFKAPHPAVVVNAGNELDVALTVKYSLLSASSYELRPSIRTDYRHQILGSILYLERYSLPCSKWWQWMGNNI